MTDTVGVTACILMPTVLAAAVSSVFCISSGLAVLITPKSQCLIDRQSYILQEESVNYLHVTEKPAITQMISTLDVHTLHEKLLLEDWHISFRDASLRHVNTTA